MMKRPDVNEYFLEMAKLVSTRGTCIRRKVGCVLVDRHKHILSIGYNGVPSGSPHCIDSPCPGAKFPSGKGLEFCEAIHAEQNALLQCSNMFGIDTCYVTCSPCAHCTKILLNTSCINIIFPKGEDYPHSNAKTMWVKNGRLWNYRGINEIN
ncbi:MAG TPA: dCMP deaminase family protein [Ignavibacteria bacterium]|nr:dCMP deaminase family protein [Ignavibacteria bacterium]